MKNMTCEPVAERAEEKGWPNVLLDIDRDGDDVMLESEDGSILVTVEFGETGYDQPASTVTIEGEVDGVAYKAEFSAEDFEDVPTIDEARARLMQ